MSSYISNGGGATHIAKVTGQLSALSSNLLDILIVSGGGGGGLLVDNTEYTGADAGGISGNGDNSANQSTGYAFGQGEFGTDVSGGGGGLYGGYKGTKGEIIPPELKYIENVNALFIRNNNGDKRDFYTANAYEYTGSHAQITNFNPSRASVYGVDALVTSSIDAHTTGYWQYAKLCAFEPLTITVITGQSSVSVSYSTTTKSRFWDGSYGTNTPCCYYWHWGNSVQYGSSIMQEQTSNPSVSFTTSFNSLSDAISYIYTRFSNITLVVDGVTWVSRE